jgi:hypothetical protein
VLKQLNMSASAYRMTVRIRTPDKDWAQTREYGAR